MDAREPFVCCVVSMFALALAGCPSAGTPQVRRAVPIQVKGDYVHAPSGMRFPEQVGEYRRLNVVRYDDRGDDVSAGYTLPRPGSPVTTTVYVYPAPAGAEPRAALRDELGKIEADI